MLHLLHWSHIQVHADHHLDNVSSFKYSDNSDLLIVTFLYNNWSNFEVIKLHFSNSRVRTTLGTEICCDDKTCPFYRFHGTPDLMIEKISESDDQIVTVISETGSQKLQLNRVVTVVSQTAARTQMWLS